MPAHVIATKETATPSPQSREIMENTGAVPSPSSNTPKSEAARDRLRAQKIQSTLAPRRE